jgi:hypothetical protein
VSWLKKMVRWLIVRKPTVPWDEYYNNKITMILSLCERHGYEVDTQSKSAALSMNDSIHFDEKDYFRITRSWSKLVRDLNVGKPLPMCSDGTIDYDRACAAEIVALSGSILRTMDEVSQDFDLTNVDRDRLRHVTNLATALEQQWGYQLWSL